MELQHVELAVAAHYFSFATGIQGDAAAGLRRLAGTDLGPRLLAAEQAFDQDLHPATAGLLPEQARRNHPGVVEHQQVARLQQRWQVAHLQVGEGSRRRRHQQQAARRAFGQGGLGDQFGRQFVMEIGLLQGSGRQQVDNGAHCTASVCEPARAHPNVAQNAAMQQSFAGLSRKKTSASIDEEVRCTRPPQARVKTRVLLLKARATQRFRRSAMSFIERLAPLRAQPGTRLTNGLDDATLTTLAANHPQLVAAVDAAAAEFARVQAELGPLLAQDEQAQIDAMQDGFVNFYADDAVTPYVALAARGPWVVTLKGAVLYDAGGYGMLGFGHTPDAVMEAMSRPQVMANIMTPSLSQQRFITALRAEIGHRRGGCPFTRFMCLNSGSDAVGLAARIADVNAKLQTDPGARHAGAAIKRVVIKGSFHGRTDRPARYSDSSRKTYMQHLASYRGEESVITVAPYDEAG